MFQQDLNSVASVPKFQQFLTDAQEYTIDDSGSLILLELEKALPTHNLLINTNAEYLLPVSLKTKSDILPIITANWKASSDNKWTVPIGGGFGRVFSIGKQPVNASLQGYWNAAKPDGGADWTLRTQFQLLFPK
ncbi:hypothetical protein STA3757_28900 [Stanieria sp. NIES-3757]|nr:hypothetical protein STA3757_28900 [Stanieria sp. NIES-3757]